MRFISLVANSWEDDNGRLCSTIFGLTAEGLVYKFVGRGWQVLSDSVVEQDNRR